MGVALAELLADALGVALVVDFGLLLALAEALAVAVLLGLIFGVLDALALGVDTAAARTILVSPAATERAAADVAGG